MGLKAVVKSKKPFLTDKNKKKHLDFARKHQNWTVQQWKRVMFSDKARINLQGVGGREWVYKPKGNRQYTNRIIKKTKKFNGGGFIVWGCMTYFGLGDASKLEGTVDAEYYKEILESYVIQTRDWYKMNKRTFIFQHDNASIHTSKPSKEFLARNHIRVLDWPAQSPDLNPIEHLWSMIKPKIKDIDPPAKTKDELWEQFQ